MYENLSLYERALARSGDNCAIIASMEISGKITLDPILYSSYTDSNDQIIDTSCDPKVCILPQQFNQFKDD